MARPPKPGKNYIWIPRTTRRLKKGSSQRVSTGGIWRKKRPKGKKQTFDKPMNVKIQQSRDEFGRITSKRKFTVIK